MPNNFQYSSFISRCTLSLPPAGGKFRGALLLLTLLLIIHCSLFINHCLAQSFADKKYYLIDSLDLSTLTPDDKSLLDSCLKVFHSAKHDTIKVNAINTFIEASNNDQVWPKYNLWLLHFSESKLKSKYSSEVNIFFRKVKASSLNNIGYIYDAQGQIPQALNYYERSLKIDEEIGNKKGMATSLNNIGAIYDNQGQIPQALDYYKRSLKIKEEIGDKKGIAISLNNIGVIYDNQGQIPEALDYYGRSLKIQEEIGDKSGIATSLNNIGYIYQNQGQIHQALDYFGRSLKIREEIGDKEGIAGSLNNIGVIYYNQGQIPQALDYYERSLKIREEIGDKKGIATSLNNIGEIYHKQGKIKEAREYSARSLSLSQELGYPKVIKSSSNLLYQIYEKQGEGMKALEMHKLYIEMRDSINNMETQKAAIKNQMQYEYEKEQAATKAEQDKKDLLTKEERAKQQIVLYATGGGLALVSVFLFLLFNRFKTTQRQKSIIEKQKHLVDEKQKEILDSIRYAKRIQDAILPSMSAMQQALKNGFVLYKPKDVVAGDFYWMERIQANKPNSEVANKMRSPSGVEVPGLGQSFGSLPSGEGQGGAIYFAAADCTGHGVPGAMMSVVCSNALSKALLEEKAQTTGELLDKTRTLVIDRLAKSGEEVKDGMDISLCALVSSSDSTRGESYRELQWSGANNPLWIVRPNRTPSLPDGKAGGAEVHGVHSVAEALEAPGVVEADLVPSGIPAPLDDQSGQNSSTSLFTTHYSLIEFKPDKQPIGMFADAKPFTTHHIELQKGDTIYIFTDGYQDQFGGDKSKKFKASKLKELLLSIQHEPMDTQKEILNNEFETWKGTLEQVDDVCVIGVRI